MSQALNAVSAVFALGATVFFIVGCSGYTTDDAQLKNVAWITADDDFAKLWIGLQKLRFEGQGVASGASGNLVWAKDSCTEPFCDRCEQDGRSAIALLIISTVFAGIATALSGVLAASHNAGMQIGNLVLSMISAFFAIIGFGVFMGSCYQKIDQWSDFDLDFGPGSIMTLLALIMMFVVTVLQFVAVIVGGGSA